MGGGSERLLQCLQHIVIQLKSDLGVCYGFARRLLTGPSQNPQSLCDIQISRCGLSAFSASLWDFICFVVFQAKIISPIAQKNSLLTNLSLVCFARWHILHLLPNQSYPFVSRYFPHSYFLWILNHFLVMLVNGFCGIFNYIWPSFGSLIGA